MISQLLIYTLWFWMYIRIFVAVGMANAIIIVIVIICTLTWNCHTLNATEHSILSGLCSAQWPILFIFRIISSLKNYVWTNGVHCSQMHGKFSRRIFDHRKCINNMQIYVCVTAKTVHKMSYVACLGPSLYYYYQQLMANDTCSTQMNANGTSTAANIYLFMKFHKFKQITLCFRHTRTHTQNCGQPCFYGLFLQHLYRVNVGGCGGVVGLLVEFLMKLYHESHLIIFNMSKITESHSHWNWMRTNNVLWSLSAHAHLIPPCNPAENLLCEAASIPDKKHLMKMLFAHRTIYFERARGGGGVVDGQKRIAADRLAGEQTLIASDEHLVTQHSQKNVNGYH